jgi:hypothetical protein
MRGWRLALVGVLLLACPSWAWTDYSNVYFCDETVKRVWGEGIYNECLGTIEPAYQGALCLELTGQAKEICMSLDETVHPATIPNALGQDNLEVVGDCPIDRYPGNEYLCAKNDEARVMAMDYIQRAIDSSSRCERIYFFCVASNYLSQNFNPFNMVVGEPPECAERIYDTVDFGLRNRQSNWGRSETCNFEYETERLGVIAKATQSQKITINARTVEQVLENLTGQARDMYTRPLSGVQTITTSTTSTSTTTLDSGIRPVSKSYCERDGDCVIVDAGCCGCNEGGQAIAVAKDYESIWEAQLEINCADVMCPQVISDHESCKSEPVCVEDKCALKAPATTSTTQTTATTIMPTTTTLRPATTTSLPAQAASDEGGIGFFGYLIALLILAGGLLFLMKNVRPGSGSGEPQAEKRVARLSNAGGGVGRSGSASGAGEGQRRKTSLESK